MPLLLYRHVKPNQILVILASYLTQAQIQSGKIDKVDNLLAIEDA
jgi:hypothetical protein